MQDLTSYARGRIVLRGMLKTIFGLVVVGMGALVIGAGATAGTAPRQPDDLPPVWMIVVGAGLAFLGLVLTSGGVGSMVSAFAGGCYFKAGPEGLAVRMPKQRWHGWFKVVEYPFKWEEIESIYPLTRSLNLIPVARELHLRLFGGNDITIERFYFAASSKRLAADLLSIRGMAGK
jgi:hypothetical protein